MDWGKRYTGLGMSCSNHRLPIREPPERVLPGLMALLEAYEYSEDTSGNCWEFAVELERLTDLGLTLNDFRWLVRNSLIEHQREVTVETDDGREFRSSGDLSFPERTCFILNAVGVEYARRCCGYSTMPEQASVTRINTGNGAGLQGKTAPTAATPKSSEGTSVRPSWDPQRRLLRINGTPVKLFKWSAHNQEAILSAFEEEGWPARIDDPLPPQPEQDSKRRLSDTIKCLNRKQVNPVIHFRGDGTGEGVVWDIVDQHPAENAHAT